MNTTILELRNRFGVLCNLDTGACEGSEIFAGSPRSYTEASVSSVPRSQPHSPQHYEYVELDTVDQIPQSARCVKPLPLESGSVKFFPSKVRVAKQPRYIWVPKDQVWHPVKGRKTCDSPLSDSEGLYVAKKIHKSKLYNLRKKILKRTSQSSSPDISPINTMRENRVCITAECKVCNNSDRSCTMCGGNYGKKYAIPCQPSQIEVKMSDQIKQLVPPSLAARTNTAPESQADAAKKMAQVIIAHSKSDNAIRVDIKNPQPKVLPVFANVAGVTVLVPPTVLASAPPLTPKSKSVSHPLMRSSVKNDGPKTASQWRAKTPMPNQALSVPAKLGEKSPTASINPSAPPLNMDEKYFQVGGKTDSYMYTSNIPDIDSEPGDLALQFMTSSSKRAKVMDMDMNPGRVSEPTKVIYTKKQLPGYPVYVTEPTFKQMNYQWPGVYELRPGHSGFNNMGLLVSSIARSLAPGIAVNPNSQAAILLQGYGWTICYDHSRFYTLYEHVCNIVRTCDCGKGVNCDEFYEGNILVFFSGLCEDYSAICKNREYANVYIVGPDPTSSAVSCGERVTAYFQLDKVEKSLEKNTIHVNYVLKSPEISFSLPINKRYASCKRVMVLGGPEYNNYALVKIGLDELPDGNYDDKDNLFVSSYKNNFYEPSYLGKSDSTMGTRAVIVHYKEHGESVFDLIHINSGIEADLSAIMVNKPKNTTTRALGESRFRQIAANFGLPQVLWIKSMLFTIHRAWDTLIPLENVYNSSMLDDPGKLRLNETLIRGDNVLKSWMQMIWTILTAASTLGLAAGANVASVIRATAGVISQGNVTPGVKQLDSKNSHYLYSNRLHGVLVAPFYEEAVKYYARYVILWFFSQFKWDIESVTVAFGVGLLFGVGEFVLKSKHRTLVLDRFDVMLFSAFPVIFHTFLYLVDNMGFLWRVFIHSMFNLTILVVSWAFTRYHNRDATWEDHIYWGFATLPRDRYSAYVPKRPTGPFCPSGKITVNRELDYSDVYQRRKLIQCQVGPILGAPPVVYANTAHAADCAFTRQIQYKPMVAHVFEEMRDEFFPGFKDMMHDLLGFIPCSSAEEYRDTLDGKQKRQVQQAIDDENVYGKDIRRYVAGAFPKVEQLDCNYSDLLGGCEHGTKVPRNITNCDKRKLIQQTWFADLTHHMSSCFKGQRGLFYASSTTDVEIGWFLGRYNHFLEIDCSKWDGHMRMEVMYLLSTLYEDLGMPPDQLSIYRQGLEYKAKVHYPNENYHGKVKVDGTVGSGDLPTSAGNTMANFLFWMFGTWRATGLTCWEIIDKFGCIALGDDMVCGSYFDDIPSAVIEDTYRCMGHEPKAFDRTIYDVSFCSQQFIHTDYTRYKEDPYANPTGVKMCVNIDRRLNRDGWHVVENLTRPLTVEERKSRALGDALSRRNQCRGIPFYQQLNDHIIDLCSDVAARTPDKEPWKAKYEDNVDIGLTGKLSVMLKYDLPFDEGNFAARLKTKDLFDQYDDMPELRQFFKRGSYPLQYFARCFQDGAETYLMANTLFFLYPLMLWACSILIGAYKTPWATKGLGQVNHLAWALGYMLRAFVLIPKTKNNSKKSKKTRSSKPRAAKARSTMKLVVRENSVPLRHNTIPKTKFTLGQRGKFVVLKTTDIIRDVQGVEIASTVVKSGNPVDVTHFFVNPGNPEIFPKTSAITAPFDKCYLKRMRVSFISALPTTAPGQIGLYIALDPSDPTVVSFKDLANYQYSVVGSVTANHSVNYIESNKRMLPIFTQGQQYAVSNSYVGNNNDSSALYNGAYRIGVLTSGLDVSQLAGWLALDCEWELFGSKPVPQMGFNSRLLNIYDKTENNVLITTLPRAIKTKVLGIQGNFENIAGNNDIYEGLWTELYTGIGAPLINQGFTLLKGIWNHGFRAAIAAASSEQSLTEDIIEYTGYYINPDFIIPEPDEKGNMLSKKETWELKVQNDPAVLVEPYKFNGEKWIAKRRYKGSVRESPLATNDVLYTLYGLPVSPHTTVVNGPQAILQITANSASAFTMEGFKRFVVEDAYRFLPMLSQANSTPSRLLTDFNVECFLNLSDV